MTYQPKAAMSTRVELRPRSALKATPRTPIRYRGPNGIETAQPERDLFDPNHELVRANRDVFRLVTDPFSPRGQRERLQREAAEIERELARMRRAEASVSSTSAPRPRRLYGERADYRIRPDYRLGPPKHRLP